MNKITFYPTSKDAELVVPPPKPAKEYIQDWYKKIKILDGSEFEFKDGSVSNFSVKACLPFYDAMAVGYIQETWCDIYFKVNESGQINYNYSGFPMIISHREKTHIPKDNLYYDVEFIWTTPWVPKTPKGYSILLVSPQNFVLPFKTLTGIIDSDNFYHTLDGSTPFYLRKDFSGLIPAGTPMYQFIMIKRDNWERSIEKWNDDEARKRLGYRMKKSYGAYKKMFYVPKKYL